MSDGRPWPCAESLRALLQPSARLLGAIAIGLAIGLALAGCASVVPGAQPVAQTRSGPIAFESVEGVPPEVFHRFVRTLNEEAAARQIAVAARGSEASYRIRSYLALDAGHGALAWAWDVYDSDQQRVLRLGGEQAAAGATRHAWSAADDQVLRRIAQAGLAQLAAFMAAGPAAPEPAAPPAPARNGAAVAFAGER
jgi:pectin methylesterase-like acyl-CoA thioesterase